MRLLRSLPQLAPALLRHLSAYAELVAQDLGRARREWSARLTVTALAAASLLFAVMMACLAVVAGTWDTPHRVSAIAWMGTGFLALAVIALLYRSRLVRAQLPFLATVKGEWQEDRLILNRVLSTGED